MLSELYSVAIRDPERGWVWHTDDLDSRYETPAVFFSHEDAECEASRLSRFDQIYAAVSLRSHTMTYYHNGEIVNPHYILQYYMENWVSIPDVQIHNFHDAQELAIKWQLFTGLAVRTQPVGLDETAVIYDCYIS